MSRTNHPDDFPDLRFSQLERYAKRWVKKFQDLPIERILLFHHSSKFEEYYGFDSLIPRKFAIVFIFSRNQTSPYWEIMHKNLPSGRGSFDPTEHIQVTENLTQFDEFIRAIEFYRTVGEQRYKGLIDSGFTSVYKHGEKPKDTKEMTDEWYFTFSMPKHGEIYGNEPNANIRDDEGQWTLYNSRRETLKNAVDEKREKDSAGSKPTNKQRRYDPMRVEIEKILAKLSEKHKKAAFVMASLKDRAGADSSCVIESKEKGVIWRDATGNSNYLDMDALRSRIGRYRKQ